MTYLLLGETNKFKKYPEKTWEFSHQFFHLIIMVDFFTIRGDTCRPLQENGVFTYQL